MNSTTGNSSLLERVFHLTEKGTTVRTEAIAGATTFLSCVSIMVLNPTILSAAGMDLPCLIGHTFQYACGGGAHTDDASACPAACWIWTGTGTADTCE